MAHASFSFGEGERGIRGGCREGHIRTASASRAACRVTLPTPRGWRAKEDVANAITGKGSTHHDVTQTLVHLSHPHVHELENCAVERARAEAGQRYGKRPTKATSTRRPIKCQSRRRRRWIEDATEDESRTEASTPHQSNGGRGASRRRGGAGAMSHLEAETPGRRRDRASSNPSSLNRRREVKASRWRRRRRRRRAYATRTDGRVRLKQQAAQPPTRCG